jgi:hypothetical protein
MPSEEAWSSSKVVMSILNVFGCCVFIFMPDQQRKKWDPTNRELVHIGYNEESRAYCTLHPVKAKILKERDIIYCKD